MNRSKVPVNTCMFDGRMAYLHNGNGPVYAGITLAGRNELLAVTPARCFVVAMSGASDGSKES